MDTKQQIVTQLEFAEKSSPETENYFTFHAIVLIIHK